MHSEEILVRLPTPNHCITTKDTNTKQQDEEKKSLANDLRFSSSLSLNDGIKSIEEDRGEHII